MKLSTVTAKLTGMKAKALKLTAVAAVTGASLAAAAPAAQAQRVVFRARVYAPAYVAPAPMYVAPAPIVVDPYAGFYYGPRRDVWVRHDRRGFRR